MKRTDGEVADLSCFESSIFWDRLVRVKASRSCAAKIGHTQIEDADPQEYTLRISLYLFRRGGASVPSEKLESDLAQRLMGHQAGGRAIHNVYD